MLRLSWLLAGGGCDGGDSHWHASQWPVHPQCARVLLGMVAGVVHADVLPACDAVDGTRPHMHPHAMSAPRASATSGMAASSASPARSISCSALTFRPRPILRPLQPADP